MPRPRDPSGYPSQYARIIHAAVIGEEEIQHPCANNKAAQLLRFSVYDYLKACRRSNNSIFQAIADEGAQLMFCVMDNMLIIRRRDHTTTALGLEATLQQLEMKLAQNKPMQAHNLPEDDTLSSDAVLRKFLDKTKKKKKDDEE